MSNGACYRHLGKVYHERRRQRSTSIYSYFLHNRSSLVGSNGWDGTMRTETRTINYYRFSELSKKAQESAIDNLWDINVSDSFWHEPTIDDLESVGIGITKFDVYYKTIKIKLDSPVIQVLRNVQANLPWLYTGIKSAGITYTDFEYDSIQYLQDKIISSLSAEYEYLQSRESVLDTIEANDYEFEENGEIL